MKRNLLLVSVSFAVLISLFVLANKSYLRDERARQFTGAAWDGNLTKMRILLLLGADVKEFAPGMGPPAIVAAAWDGHPEIVEFLRDRGADINATMKLNNTALSTATYNGHLETVRLLLSRGAALNIVGDGGSALHFAIEKRHTEIAELLRQHGAKDCYEHQFDQCH
jgi:ankyrin repeat protein